MCSHTFGHKVYEVQPALHWDQTVIGNAWQNAFSVPFGLSEPRNVGQMCIVRVLLVSMAIRLFWKYLNGHLIV